MKGLGERSMTLDPRAARCRRATGGEDDLHGWLRCLLSMLLPPPDLRAGKPEESDAQSDEEGQQRRSNHAGAAHRRHDRADARTPVGVPAQPRADCAPAVPHRTTAQRGNVESRTVMTGTSVVAGPRGVPAPPGPLVGWYLASEQGVCATEYVARLVSARTYSLGAVELVSTVEIADLVGLSRQRVDQLSRQGGFPSPVASLAIGRVWARADVIDWAKRTNRLPADFEP